MASRDERIEAFRARWAAAPPARSFDEAYGILNEVEDELHDRPFNPATAATDKRLYPPPWDRTGRDPKRQRV